MYPDKNAYTLHGIDLPLDAINYILIKDRFLQKRYGKLEYMDKSSGIEYWTSIKQIEKFEIVGEITSDSLSFKPEYYIDSDIDQVWKEYIHKGEGMVTPEESFRSLLELNKIFFVNPCGKKPHEFDFHCCNENLYEAEDSETRIKYYQNSLENWLHYESLLFSKLLILKKCI